MAKGGAKLIDIDKEQFEKLCGLQCTLAEIASWFRCSDDTIERWCLREYKQPFAEIFKQKRALGKISLRRMQWQAAEAGNTALLIFLGKQFLDQADKREDRSTLEVSTSTKVTPENLPNLIELARQEVHKNVKTQ